MLENENLVVQEAAENVENPTEETPKTYTEAEFNQKLDEALGKKIARKEAKIRKEFERKYGDLESMLRAGTGKESVEEITDSLKEFYQGRGIEMPKKSDFSKKDIETLGRADAEEFIRAGYDEIEEELERLTNLGADKMSEREQIVYKALFEHQSNTQKSRELAELGVSEEVYNSKEFKDFAKKFNSDTSIKDIYDIYSKQKPKKEIKTMGSLKSTSATDEGLKDFYTPDEAKRFTVEDFNRNPAVFANVVESMKHWK